MAPSPENHPRQHISRLRLNITGAVQGLGFRPFVFRLAEELHLAGWVRNTPAGVEIEIEGHPKQLSAFRTRLETDAPPLARLFTIEPCTLPPAGYAEFNIQESGAHSAAVPVILPELATCDQCVADIFNPDNRRYYYPFTNCTHCGPRYTIIEDLPYDRERTAMRIFSMCSTCREEYGNPADRRFHAQPNACPDCGPSLLLYDATGTLLRKGRKPGDIKAMLNRAVDTLRSGGIVSILGLGGVQLLTDAANEEAVRRLRSRKARDAKPFALMVPTVETARTLARLSPDEERILRSPSAPIVLLTRRAGAPIAPSVAACSPSLGIMLPHTPLHHLLLKKYGAPLVCTSGNLSGAPLCHTPEDALRSLRRIADLHLLHDRPILRPVDDSVVRVFRGREIVVRRARGYAPLPVGPSQGPDTLALGGELKNTLCWRAHGLAVLSQHLGDLETEASTSTFRREIDNLGRLLHAGYGRLIVDSHPDYAASRYGRYLALKKGLTVISVQHHVAHVMACIEENHTPRPALGTAWDGTGYGTDGTIWGGEFFDVGETDCRRIAHLRLYPLPGGDAAAREPARCALSLLHSLSAEACPTLRKTVNRELAATVRDAVRSMMDKCFNSPLTSSMGRLFDAVSCYLGFHGPNLCEGHAAMQLETLARRYHETEQNKPSPLSWEIREENGCLVCDWEPVLRLLDSELKRGASAEELAWRFHDGLAELIVRIAQSCRRTHIAVGGGCFLNTLLLDLLCDRTEQAGLTFDYPQRVPAHDGGLAYGQLAAAGLTLTTV